VINRRPVFESIDRQIAAVKDRDAGFAVFAVHVCGLREIALRFGIELGERAEQDAETLIRNSLRPIDEVFQTGEETFAVILPELRKPNHALLAATRLVRAFEQTLNDEATPWQGRAVMGAVFYPDHGIDADALWRHAELCADDAQRRGEPWIFHEPDSAHPEIGYHDLRENIEANRLRTYFQPIWDLQSSRLIAAESLTRWNSPKHGDVQPGDFVSFAEQSDLIAALTRWSINSTFRHASMFRGATNLSFAINLSPRVFVRPGLAEQLTDALSIWGVAPTSVIVEVTETALVNDFNSTVRILQRLRDDGIRIAIDDFGTGYASISYLRRFPATELKIDKSLVSQIQTDARTATLVDSIVRLAHNMGLTATAEGIEDAATQQQLADMHCDFGQGYHLGVPVPAAEFMARFAPANQPAHSA
jgi:EAL domain-containing protein (putative c-di-GMP-specific phosphodiesterase class I)/GGDEF domain-containing protein